MNTDELRVGSSYFMVTYPDAPIIGPVILTYCYLGRNLLGKDEDEPDHFYFRYLPGTQEDETALPDSFSWRESFPALFAGWGENYPSTFEAEQLSGFHDLVGLIEELREVQQRQEAGPRVDGL